MIRLGGGWVRSTRCDNSSPNCLEARWQTSSYSAGNGACVEARTGEGVVQVRDSKAGEAGPVLSFTPDAWTAFVAGVTAGEFNLP